MRGGEGDSKIDPVIQMSAYQLRLLQTKSLPRLVRLPAAAA